MQKKPLVLFFSRDYQSKFYPNLTSDKYDSIHVTLNKHEKENVEKGGGKVVACFEEDFKLLKEADISYPYLEYSIGSDRFLKGYSHEERLGILRKTVYFWQHIMDTYKPDFVMNEVVALEISEIMLLEARKRNITYLATGAFCFDNTFFWHPNPFHSEIDEELRKANPGEQQYKEAKEFIRNMRAGAAENPHIKVLRKSKDIRNLIIKLYSLMLQILKVFTIREKAVRQICYYHSISYYLGEIGFYLNFALRGGSYDKLDDIPDKTEVIFYPLHFEPEATMFYLSPFYDNQFAFLENVLKCMREDQVLVIKEHPAQAGFLVQKKFRELKKRYPNVVYLKANLPSIRVINRAQVIVTLVSTAGFEAMTLGKPVIVVGKVYYNAYKGVNYCRSFEEMYDLFRGIRPYNKGTDGELEDYIARMLSILKPGYPWPHPRLYTAENISNIKSELERRVLAG